MGNDDQMEKYLGEFRPRVVRTLVLPRPVARTWPKVLGAAAVLLICAGSAAWYARRVARIEHPGPGQSVQVEPAAKISRPDTISLTKLALEDEGKFRAEMSAESRTVLPGFRGQQSGLRILVQE